MTKEEYSTLSWEGRSIVDKILKYEKEAIESKDALAKAKAKGLTVSQYPKYVQLDTSLLYSGNIIEPGKYYSYNETKRCETPEQAIEAAEANLAAVKKSIVDNQAEFERVATINHKVYEQAIGFMEGLGLSKKVSKQVRSKTVYVDAAWTIEVYAAAHPACNKPDPYRISEFERDIAKLKKSIVDAEAKKKRELEANTLVIEAVEFIVKNRPEAKKGEDYTLETAVSFANDIRFEQLLDGVDKAPLHMSDYDYNGDFRDMVIFERPGDYL